MEENQLTNIPPNSESRPSILKTYVEIVAGAFPFSKDKELSNSVNTPFTVGI